MLSGLDMPDLVYNREYLSPPATNLQLAMETLHKILRKEGLLKSDKIKGVSFDPAYLPGDHE